MEHLKIQKSSEQAYTQGNLGDGARALAQAQARNSDAQQLTSYTEEMKKQISGIEKSIQGFMNNLYQDQVHISAAHA